MSSEFGVRSSELKAAGRTRQVLRALAIPVGLNGFFGLLGCLFMFRMISGGTLMLALGLFAVCLSAYLLYTAYLVWFRFSHVAIHHLCAVYSVGAMGLTYKFFPPFSSTSPDSFPFLGLLPFAGAVVLYKVSVRLLLKTGVADGNRV